MRKHRILTVTVAALAVLVISAGPVLAGNIEFTGYRERAAPVDPGTKIIVGCNVKGSDQIAYWNVFTDNGLVTGYWVNTDTKSNVLIDQYQVAGVWYDCDPTDPPDPIPTMANIVRKAGIVHGPFTLVPTADVGGGYWEGVWKVLFHPDGDRFFTATAKGIGGDLEGLTLKVSARMGPPGPGVPADFNGFIVYPGSAD